MSPEKATSGTLSCARCSYIWIPRKEELPKRCPKCRSIKWNNPNLKITCLRCGHSWNSHNGTPKRCPSCGTHQWNVPPQEHECKRCGYVWHSKGRKVPCRCPMCTSRSWSQDIDEFEEKSKRHAEEDSLYDEIIMKGYRSGMSCVDISILNSIPYSKVYSVIRKNLSATTSIKV